jgi:uncharacterized protein with WD repeat
MQATEDQTKTTRNPRHKRCLFTTDYTASNDRMINELERMRKQAVVAWYNVPRKTKKILSLADLLA